MRGLRSGAWLCAAIAIMAMTAFAGCGGGGGGSEPTDAVSVNTLDGKSDVPVDSIFRYTFSQVVNAASVTASTFFIVPAPALSSGIVKAAYDPAVCNAAAAVAASVACSSGTVCDLDPTADLEVSTQYAACLSPEITYSTLGGSFEGFMATFTTAAGGDVTFTAKLVRLDSSELDLTAGPIPRAVKVKYIPSVALTDAASRQAFEAAVTLKDGSGAAVAGAYEWAADGSYALFTPAARLGYKTIYTIEVVESSLPASLAAKGFVSPTLSFTTLTKNDINGDGYADLIVGAYTDKAASPPGKLYIFYGTATGISTCDISATACYGAVLTGAASDQLGLSNDIVGDVNGDGYEDFIVGASQVYNTQKGKAYIFAGGTALTGTLATSQAQATITDGAVGADELGYSVAGAGDMNGDGYDDVIISAPETNTGYGAAYVFAGGASLAGALDVTSATQGIAGQSGDRFGMMLDGAGDVNGDGLADVIVGSDKNRAYVFYGAASLAATRNAAAADAIVTGTVKFGNSVAGAGDVNGDGIADVMIGEPVVNAGIVYVFLGEQLAGSTLTSTDAAFKISETSGNDDQFGRTLAAAGDIDGDGLDDLLIGGQTASPPTDWGKAYVFLGKNLAAAMTDLDADTTVTGNLATTDLLSLGLAGATDLNGDGYDDIVLGAPQYGVAGKGYAAVFHGSATGIPDCTFQTPSPTCSPAATLTGAAKDALGFMGTTFYHP